MDIFLDTSFVISLLIETEKTKDAREFFNETADTFVTCVSVYEETFFVGIIKKNGYDFADTLLNYMHEIFDIAEVVCDTNDIKLIENVATTCRLMPNDALIAATCKYYGIRKLATFDDDFNRVDFLEVVKTG
jgi:predicted nucleic acid-binding protein